MFSLMYCISLSPSSLALPSCVPGGGRLEPGLHLSEYQMSPRSHLDILPRIRSDLSAPLPAR